MGDTFLNSCDPILTMNDAEMPIVTPLLPVKGLRHDISGNLTKDSINTIMDGVKSLGIQIDSESTKTALLQEAKNVLCKLNSQYEFLLNNMFSSIARSETDSIDKETIDKLRRKNQNMQDILSVSRHVLTTVIDKPKEGFQPFVSDPLKAYKEAFQEMDETVSANANALATRNFQETRARAVEVTEDKNRYASTLISIYSFLNVATIGVLLYVINGNLPEPPTASKYYR